MYKLLRYLFGTTITVTQQDIDHREYGNETNCPIALAIQREVDKKYGFLKYTGEIKLNQPYYPKRQVHITTTNSAYGSYHAAFYIHYVGNIFNNGRWAWHSSLPKEVKQFIKNFDNKKEVQPLTFKVII